MHWIDGANNVPNKFGSGENGFSEGNPTTGVRGTILTAKWLDDVQRNLIEVIKAGGTGLIEGNPTDLYRAIQQLITLAIPNQSIAPGTILMFGGAAAPGGWLLCNGSAVSRAGFGNLFSTIGTTYGVGDGATTFNLPDLRGRAAIGAGQGLGLSNRTLGVSGGEEAHLLTVAEMPLHGHPARISTTTASTAQSQNNGGMVLNNTNNANYASFTGAPGTTAGQQIGGEGGGGAHNTMPPFLAVNHIIKF
jgi:microcystin-dependent protein